LGKAYSSWNLSDSPTFFIVIVGGLMQDMERLQEITNVARANMANNILVNLIKDCLLCIKDTIERVKNDFGT
jgi:hypothetical protein